MGRHLSDLYFNKVYPLEKAYQFDKFYTPCWTRADFDSKPLILVLGQYSVGKTSFIQHLLGREYPGSHVSPEPTTDRFVAIMHGDREKTIPGNAAVMQEDKPFETLKSYGMQLLNRFEVVETPANILQDVTLIDSPGVLSGEKQRAQRKYDFASLVRHWAERSERIMLLFDAHKLDISDELKEAILALDGNADKIRCVLNKADRVGPQELMRVYGSLMWSLGKVLDTPEVMRVYVGSFWDQPYVRDENTELFDRERDDLMRDLKQLPQHSCVRKINEFAKRLRHVRVHSVVCDALRSQFSLLSLKSRGQQQAEMLRPEALLQTYAKLSKKHGVHVNDFPDVEQFRETVEQLDIDLYEFSKLETGYLEAMDKLLADEMPRLFQKLGQDEQDLVADVARARVASAAAQDSPNNTEPNQ